MKSPHDRMLRALSAQLNGKKVNEIKILEIGCGNADFVAFARSYGYQISGADVEFKPGENLQNLQEHGLVRKILADGYGRLDVKQKSEAYRWPYENEEFDIVISKATIEHVANIAEFTAENARVLKRGGKAIHYFPSQTALIEPHIRLPFAGMYYKNDFLISFFRLLLGKKITTKKFLYMINYCFYRSGRSLISSFQDSGLKFSNYSENTLFKVKIPRPFDKLFWVLFRTFRSKLMIFTKE